MENAKQIMFNVEMTKAILEGRKTQTRRAISLVNDSHTFDTIVANSDEENAKLVAMFSGSESFETVNLKHRVDDILWVREPARVIDFDINKMTCRYISDKSKITLKIPERFCLSDLSKENKNVSPFRKQLFSSWIWNTQGIPNGCIKVIARIFLKVTDVRVERLQDISLDDLVKEGFIIKDNGSRKYIHFASDDCEVESIVEPTERCGFSMNFREYENCPECGRRMEIENATIIRSEALSWWEKIWNKVAPLDYKIVKNPYVFVYEFERV